MSEPFKRLQHRVWTWNFAGELHMGSKDRQRVIEYMFRNCQAGLIGFQEVTTENVEAIRRIRSDWRLVVHPAKPYMTPIAYNHHRYALKNSEIIYFSDDKTEKVSWGADTTRSGVLAEFFDGETHRHFLMVNLHLDNVSAESRKQSINMVIDRLQSYRSIDTQDKLPIIVTGDFNMSRQVPEDLLYTDGDPEKPQLPSRWNNAAMTAPYEALEQVGLIEAWEAKYPKEQYPHLLRPQTFHGFDGEHYQLDKWETWNPDYIFVRDFQVNNVRVIKDSICGIDYSDHWIFCAHLAYESA